MKRRKKPLQEAAVEELEIFDPYQKVVVSILHLIPNRDTKTRLYQGMRISEVLEGIPPSIRTDATKFLEKFESNDTIYSFRGTLIVKPATLRFEEVKHWRYQVHAWNWSPREDPPRWVMMPKGTFSHPPIAV